MHGYWSLVIFTLLGQAAAGMLILSFFSRTADTSRAKAWAACILLGVGALASLEHLSDPTVSFYTITDRSIMEFAVHLLALSRHQPAARFQPAALHGRPCHPEGS